MKQRRELIERYIVSFVERWYVNLIAAFLIVLLLACAAEPVTRPTQLPIEDVYATANAKADELATRFQVFITPTLEAK